jgi:uncharacterized protein (DUF433 family)
MRRVFFKNCKLMTKREDVHLKGNTGSKTGVYQSEKGDERELIVATLISRMIGTSVFSDPTEFSVTTGGLGYTRFGIVGEQRRRLVMAALDWSQCPAVESVPGRLSGAWVFRDTRMPVSAVFENLEAGATIEEIIEQFDLTREQINAVLEFAARSLDPVPTPAVNSPVDAHSLRPRNA